jgi:PAS domain S-box-containing protein
MAKQPIYNNNKQKIEKLERKIETLSKLNKSLSESEMKYQLILQNLPTIVYRGFKDWSVEFADDKVALLTGYSRGEFNSKQLKWSDLILKEDLESAKTSFVEALKRRASYDREYRIKTRSGDIIWIQDRGRITYDNGEVKYIIGTFFDISDRKKVLEELKKRNDQLIQARKMASLGILTAGVAHELNNPLNNISTSIQILLEELGEGDIEHQRNLLIGAENEIERAKNIVKALLEFSRQKSLNLKPVHFKYFVEKTIGLIKGGLPSAININMNVADDIEAYLDPKRIQQVIINLVENSVQAIKGEKGSISIEAWKGTEGDAKIIYCRIQDTGHGILKNDLEKIFDPFFTTKDVGCGSGLGLSICHNIIEQHGGRIDVESIPGEKTTFTLVLPLD